MDSPCTVRCPQGSRSPQRIDISGRLRASGSYSLEEVFGPHLAALQYQLESVQLAGVGVCATERCAGLGRAGPSQRVDPKLGDRMARCVAACQDDASYAGGADDLLKHRADLPAQSVSHRGNACR